MKPLFIINLTYKKSLLEVEKYLKPHQVYLDHFYSKGNFICSGRKEPRTGGIIICHFNTLDEVQEVIKDDPFNIHSIAEYFIVEFSPSKLNESLFQMDKMM